MGDLEERALRRDRRYLVRLVLGLLAGVLIGGFIFAKLTGAEAEGCAARMVGGEAADGASGGDSPAQAPNPAP